MESEDPEWNAFPLSSKGMTQACHLTPFNFHLLSAKMWLFLPDKIIMRVRERERTKTTIDCSSFSSGSALSVLSGAGNLLFSKTR